MYVKSIVGAMSAKFPVNNTSGGTLAKWCPCHLSKDKNCDNNCLRISLRIDSQIVGKSPLHSSSDVKYHTTNQPFTLSEIQLILGTIRKQLKSKTLWNPPSNCNLKIKMIIRKKKKLIYHLFRFHEIKCFTCQRSAYWTIDWFQSLFIYLNFSC